MSDTQGKVGPTEITDELFQEICDRLTEGESLRQICRDGHMPTCGAIYTMLRNEENRARLHQYRIARDIQTDVKFEELEEIAEDGSNDWIEKELDNGRIITVPDHEHISRSKLRVETKKWVIGKMKPKKYGDKIDVTSDGEKITSINVNIVNGTQSTGDQRISEELPEQEENQSE